MTNKIGMTVCTLILFLVLQQSKDNTQQSPLEMVFACKPGLQMELEDKVVKYKLSRRFMMSLMR